MRAEAYQRFLRSKVAVASIGGFEVDDSEINPILKPFQRAIVRWALRGGQRAIFARFGLGKTMMQLEVLRLILKYAGGRGLIVAPLGVRQEFAHDVHVLNTGDDPSITDAQRAELDAWHAADPDRMYVLRFIRGIEEAGETGLYITNYETVRDGKLDPRHFTAASLDEASVLRGLTAKEAYRLWKRYNLAAVYDFEHHVRIGEALEAKGSLPPTFMLLPPHSWHPDVWSDVARMRTLNSSQVAKGREMHLCPLQFDIVDRLITQFSMEDETVFDPFAGVGTVPVRALQLGRRAIGVELNPTYFLDGVSYVESAARKRPAPSLADLAGAPDDADDSTPDDLAA